MYQMIHLKSPYTHLHKPTPTHSSYIHIQQTKLHSFHTFVVLPSSLCSVCSCKRQQTYRNQQRSCIISFVYCRHQANKTKTITPQSSCACKSQELNFFFAQPLAHPNVHCAFCSLAHKFCIFISLPISIGTHEETISLSNEHNKNINELHPQRSYFGLMPTHLRCPFHCKERSNVYKAIHSLIHSFCVYICIIFYQAIFICSHSLCFAKPRIFDPLWHSIAQ